MRKQSRHNKQTEHNVIKSQWPKVYKMRGCSMVERCVVFLGTLAPNASSTIWTLRVELFLGGSNTVINISPNPSSIYSPLSQAHFLTWKEHSVIFLKWINECNNETDDTPTSTLTTWNWHPASESRTCGSHTHGLSQPRVNTWVTSGSFWNPHGWTTWVSMAVVSRWPWSSLWDQRKCPNMSTQ